MPKQLLTDAAKIIRLLVESLEIATTLDETDFYDEALESAEMMLHRLDEAAKE